MKRNLIYIIFLLPVLMFGQERLHVSLDWGSMQTQQTVMDMEINYLTFDEAANLGEFGSLPVFYRELKPPDDVWHYEVSVNSMLTDTLDAAESEALSDADLIPFEVVTGIIPGETTSALYVLPFYKNEDRIIRLLDFELSIDLVPAEPETRFGITSVDYKTQSVLETGRWFKLGITERGVHKLTHSDLETMGLDPVALDVERLGIFGNYNGLLPEANGKARVDDLQENSIHLVGTDDGTFDDGDYLLFYAQGPTTWKYNVFTGRYDHTVNIYADTIFYFFTPDAGSKKEIQKIESVDDEPSETVNHFIDYALHEMELENLIYSGKEWFGERLTGDTLERTFYFEFPNLLKDRAAFINFEMVARGFINTYYNVFVNDDLVIDTVRINKVSSNSSVYANRVNRRRTFFAEKDLFEVKVEYLTEDVNTVGWINYIGFNVERELRFTGGQMGFREPHVSAAGNITRFNVEDASQDNLIWDISDPHHPVDVTYELSDGVASFTIPTNSLKDFIIFDQTAFLSPVSFETVENQNLHGISAVDFIIISPEMFLDQANRLAKLHESHDGLEVIVVTPDQIYNEFSSGSQDITAIRDFMRMLYKKGVFGEEHGYMLAFGDASYDYKHRVHANTNIIPTYQSDESLRLTGSFVTDDYFGLLDDDEGDGASGILDLGVGRFPVSTPEEAKNAVDKVAHYLAGDLRVMSGWRNEICFVADDGDKNLHMSQAKLLISITDTLHDGININKIFSDAYTKVSIPGGKRYPDVNSEINRQVSRGAQIVNYTGHGGLIGWSEELILNVSMIRDFENYDNLPLFITATCEFSRFDDPEFISAGEYVFLNEKGGGIGLLTTTRLAYAHANIVVNQRIYKNLLEKENGERPRLGDLIRLSKNPSSVNYLNFVLLGDPVLKLSFPENEVITELVNNKSVGADADTVHALSTVTVSGYIRDESGNNLENFNGYLYPKVYDKASKYSTLGNDHNSYPEEFTLMDKILFDGKVSVSNGRFSFSFVVPRDIAYHYDFGKISYYAVDTVTMTDAWGAYENMYIGGYDESVEQDNEGPEINLFLNDETFVSGGTTNSSPLLLADISDEQGVNFTGHSLGRDITMVLDDDWANSMVVNEYFTLALDTYKQGKLSYLFNHLEKGWHTLTLKAWDLQNNSSQKTIEFFVNDAADILLSDVYNYPNPFAEYTTFEYSSNKNGGDLDVEVKIYDIHGRYVGSMTAENDASSLTWNGRDQYGNEVPAGFYTYHIIVSDTYGNTTIQRQKMIKMNK
jgi:hypothetical protein